MIMMICSCTVYHVYQRGSVFVNIKNVGQHSQNKGLIHNGNSRRVSAIQLYVENNFTQDTMNTFCKSHDVHSRTPGVAAAVGYVSTSSSLCAPP